MNKLLFETIWNERRDCRGDNLREKKYAEVTSKIDCMLPHCQFEPTKGTIVRRIK